MHYPPPTHSSHKESVYHVAEVECLFGLAEFLGELKKMKLFFLKKKAEHQMYNKTNKAQTNLLYSAENKLLRFTPPPHLDTNMGQ